MKTLCDFSITSARHRPRHIWDPGALFQVARLGAWYDFSDLSVLFQDAAGTIPVTSDGDPVGCVQDKSGNGHDAVQVTPAARPTWRTNGSLSWIEFDGVDDHMVIPAIAYTAPMTTCLGLQRFAEGSWSSFRSAKVIPPYINTGSATPSSTGAVTNSAGGSDRVDGVVSSYNRQELYTALLTPRVGTAFANTSTSLHAEGTFFCYGHIRASGKVFGYAEWDDANLAEVAQVEHWMAKKTGVVL
ncbi:hypothetical protein [Shimia aestuarii]|uniref:hypothetical protein n=1 Tax=Shimia aestuarii TaxID=254406 RepID=UPI001FB3707C|nr:hypothetical protein [Shimia aestuarii]